MRRAWAKFLFSFFTSTKVNSEDISKHFIKADVMQQSEQLPCEHIYRSGFDGKTSYIWCPKCKERW